MRTISKSPCVNPAYKWRSLWNQVAQPYHGHTDTHCMQIPKSLGPTTLSLPILVTSNPQKYPNMERWSVHPFFFGVWELSHVEPALFVWSKSSRQFFLQPSHAFLISFSRFFFNSTFISKYQQPLSLRILNIFQHISSVQPGDIHHTLW
jgi:hypothetical protein